MSIPLQPQTRFSRPRPFLSRFTWQHSHQLSSCLSCQPQPDSASKLGLHYFPETSIATATSWRRTASPTINPARQFSLTRLLSDFRRPRSRPSPGSRPLRLKAASTADVNAALVLPVIDKRRISLSVSSTSDSETLPNSAPQPAPDGTSGIAPVTRPDNTSRHPAHLHDLHLHLNPSS